MYARVFVYKVFMIYPLFTEMSPFRIYFHYLRHRNHGLIYTHVIYTV